MIPRGCYLTHSERIGDKIRDVQVFASIRSIMRAPVFAAPTVLTIAIGIGLNTAVFSIIYAALLEPLPFRDPSRLVYISAGINSLLGPVHFQATGASGMGRRLVPDYAS